MKNNTIKLMKMYLVKLVIMNDKTLFNDYGQQWDRQSLRKDFDLKKTYKHVKHYNDKRVN